MSINPKTNSVAERQKLKVAHLIVFFFPVYLSIILVFSFTAEW